MAEFLTGAELNNTIGHLFEAAKAQIIIISPYIKLHSGYRKFLSIHKNDPNVELTVVFGKNENDISKSMSLDDFSFFRAFANVEIRYEPRLHAKYYSNERFAILTSMNLYSFSQDNNIEAGIITQASRLKNIASAVFSAERSLDKKAWDFVASVIRNSEIKYQRFPQYEKKFFKLSKKYITSYVNLDNLSNFYGLKSLPKLGDDPFGAGNSTSEASSSHAGYCIRTGSPIQFNPDKPYCLEAYRSWARYKNFSFREKFCHFSGEPSNGQTTFSKPILKKNWGKAKSMFDI